MSEIHLSSRFLTIAIASVIAASLVTATITVDAAPAHAAAPSPLELRVTSDPSDLEYFEAGQTLTYTYTITNNRDAAFETGAYPGGSISFLRAPDAAAPVLGEDCFDDQLDGEPYDNGGLWEQYYYLPEVLGAHESLTCTVTYAATAADVDRSGLWARLLYSPATIHPVDYWWYWYTNPSAGHDESPTISGTSRAGETLTAIPGVWGPSEVPLEYQWYRGSTKLSGKTAPTYALTNADVGAKVHVTVKGSPAGDSDFATRSSPETATIIGVLLTSTPTVSGSAVLGQTLTAVPGTWGPAPVSLAYQWRRDGVDLLGKTAVTYAVTAADLGHTLSVSVTGTRTSWLPATLTSAETSSVVGKLTAPTPTVTGTGAVGQTLTAVPGTWGPAPVDLAYQWYRSGEAVEGETTSTYVLGGADAGTTVTVTVTGTKDNYTTQSKLSVGKTIGKVLSTSVPTISGTSTVGQILTAVPGTWGPAPVSLAYQWKRNGVPIPGALSAAYKAIAADSGKAITVTVTGSKATYTSTSETSAPQTVGGAFTAAPTPTITGNPTAGVELTANVGNWGPAPVTLEYQWYRDGAPLGGETSTTYTAGITDAANVLTFEVTATKAGYTTVTKTSPGVLIGLPLTNIGTPLISGARTVGQVLSVDPGAWGPNPVSFSYQWKRNGAVIPGATSPFYTAVAADAGKQLTITVAGSRPSYTPVSVTSAPVTIALALTSPTPTITGTPTVGQKLTAAPGVWGPAPVPLSYQWKRDGAPIDEARAATYILTGEDFGTQITVTVSGSKVGYTAVSRSSSPVTVGLALDPAPVPAISGTPTVGETLGAVTGTWGPDFVDLSFQWKRAGVNIAGATDPVYELVSADLGKAITLTVTGSKDAYTPVSKTSAAMTIGSAFTLSPTPTVTGTPAVGSTLTAVPGIWGPAPVALSYQWHRDGGPIAGAKAAAYKLVAADAGQIVTVVVTGAKAGYTPLAELSADVNVQSQLTAVVPTISGIPTVGESVSVVTGTWAPNPVDLAVQWKRNGVALPGETDPSYTLVSADLGKQLTVTVIGSKPGYTTASTTSAAKLIGSALTLTPTPTITGTPAVGQTLTAVSGTWGPAPVALAYQWSRNGTPIAGAKAAVYKLVTADAGQFLSVTVTGNKAGHTPVAMASALLETEALLTTQVPTITGVPTVGQTLSVVTGTWGPDLVDLSLQWKRAGVSIAGATDPAYSLVSADLGKAITVTVTGSKSGYTTTSTTSAAKAIGNAFTLAPVPTVNGTPAVGSTLTAAPGTWGPPPVTLAYQWYRNGTPIGGAKAVAYKPVTADAGQWVTVTVTGSKAGYTPVPQTSIGKQVESLLTGPVPTISGTPTVGEVLSAIPGTWTPAPVDLSYQWKRNNVALAGATDPDYTLVTDDIGTSITVTVTGSKDGYTDLAKTSAAKAIGRVFTLSPVPGITGTPAVGQTLTAVPGSWSPAPVTLAYQWSRNGTPIAGAKAATYKLVTADAGQTVTVTVTGSKAGYTPYPQTSEGTAVQLLLTAVVPTVTGTPTVGSLLTVHPGEWGPDGVELSYQWKRNGAVLAGKIDADYVPVTADLGTQITVTVTGVKEGYTTTSATSAAKAIGALLTSSVPVVTGTPSVGSILTATAGTWGPAPVTLKYQWYRGSTLITGATAATYKLVTADAGQWVTVTVTGSKAGHTPVVTQSTGTAVEYLLGTGTPTISGVAAVGETLSANHGSWVPSGVAFDFQWKRTGVAIAGATSSTYGLVPADAGKAITVSVTGSKDDYTSATTTSVAIVPFATASVPTVTGGVTVGSVQTAVVGSWGAAPVVLKYQWKRDGVNIAGATAVTYTLTAADVTTDVTVTVTGTKAGYTTVVRESDPVQALFSLIATPKPYIDGMPFVGYEVSVYAGGWGPTPVDLTYQWYADGIAIPGATTNVYIVDVPVGTLLTVAVTGSKANYFSVTKVSSPVPIYES